MKIVILSGLLFLSLFAQEVNLPVELNAWKSLSYVGAANSADELSKSSLEVGKASYVGLNKTPKMKYVVRPMNEGGTVSYGGIFEIKIPENGTYRVALGNASWIDMVQDGKSAQSLAHNGGPENSGIRKMVDYNLKAGTCVVQLSAGADSTTAVLITKIK